MGTTLLVGFKLCWLPVAPLSTTSLKDLDSTQSVQSLVNTLFATLMQMPQARECNGHSSGARSRLACQLR